MWRVCQKIFDRLKGTHRIHQEPKINHITRCFLGVNVRLGFDWKNKQLIEQQIWNEIVVTNFYWKVDILIQALQTPIT